ncbi:unnamed protein product [Echinostoma caproni]|uniref:Reverse transcriptase n=1 Tax=Echinostoma caproni TaxID=27848 RepID=A0A183BBU7_9TREM|nr:unnamed protein product [Echinostoma caproni]
MVALTSPTNFNYGDYAASLVDSMRQLHIQPPRQQTPLAYLLPLLAESSQVSIDRLKPAHLEETITFTNGPPHVAPPTTPVPTSPAPSTPVNPTTPLEQASDPDPPYRITSRGRVLK